MSREDVLSLDARIELWAAVNEYAESFAESRGRTPVSVRRMNAVVAVESVVADIAAQVKCYCGQPVACNHEAHPEPLARATSQTPVVDPGVCAKPTVFGGTCPQAAGHGGTCGHLAYTDQSAIIEAMAFLGNALYPGHDGNAPAGTSNTLWSFAKEAARRLTDAARPAASTGRAARPAREVAHEIFAGPHNWCTNSSYDPAFKRHSSNCDSVTKAIEAIEAQLDEARAGRDAWIERAMVAERWPRKIGLTAPRE